MPDGAIWNYVPTWAGPAIVLAILTLYILSRAAEASESVAKCIPVLGKTWRERGLRRSKQEDDRIESMAKRVLEKTRPFDYEALSKQLAHIQAQIRAMEITEQINQAYLVEDARWHSYVDVAAAEGLMGAKIKLPPRIAYTEFSRKWREEGWRPVIT